MPSAEEMREFDGEPDDRPLDVAMAESFTDMLVAFYVWDHKLDTTDQDAIATARARAARFVKERLASY
jgi:hypothetical protein